MTFARHGERLLYRPEEAAEMLAIGRAKLFELLASGEIESLKIGASRRISRRALDAYIAHLSGSVARPAPAQDADGADAA